MTSIPHAATAAHGSPTGVKRVIEQLQGWSSASMLVIKEATGVAASSLKAVSAVVAE